MMTGTVPFDFVVNHTAFPAGEYVVAVNSYVHGLLIQNKAEPKYTTFAANIDISVNQSETQNQSRMVFAVNDGKHVLHQVYFALDNHTHDIVHPRDVIELASTP